jgi:hypothetical protein
MSEKKKAVKTPSKVKKPIKTKLEKVVAANPKQDVLVAPKKVEPVLKTTPAGNFDEVSGLLEQARKAHLAAKVYARGEARPIGFKAHWQTAYDARKRAHELDPVHLAPAWRGDKHEQFMSFYEQKGCL